MVLAFNLLIVLVLVANAFSHSSPSLTVSKDLLKDFSENSHSLKVSHFVDMLMSHPDTKEVPAKHLTTTAWVQGGWMSLNYYNQPSGTSAPTCATGGEIIYTGIDLGQCINDLNDSGNSYFFSCDTASSIITFSTSGIKGADSIPRTE